MSDRTCNHPGCAATKLSGRGLCRRHYQAFRSRLIAYGRWDAFADAEPVRHHLARLSGLGMSISHLERISGISHVTILAIRRGDYERVRRTTAERLLAIAPEIANLPATAFIDGLGSRRRLQALITIGWSQARLAGLLAVSPNRVSAILHSERVQVVHHRAIAALFDRLWNVSAPARDANERRSVARVRHMAERNGWLPPLAWDDPDTDEEPPQGDDVEGGEVDENAVELACLGEDVHLTYAESREAVARLVARKLLDSEIAERLHIASRTVLRIRQERELSSPYMERLGAA